MAPPHRPENGGDYSSAPDAETRFRELFNAYYRPITAYARRRIDQHDAAEDVVADTFLVAWRRIDAVPDGDAALPWLIGVARRNLANARRGNARRARLAQAVNRARATPGSDVHDGIARSDTEHLVLAALARIRPHYAEILRLVAWDGLSHVQVAAVLGCSTNAVAIRLHRARAALAAELQN